MTAKKISVLEVNKLYYPVTGGIERLVQQIAEGLNERVNLKVLVCKKKGFGLIEKVNGVEVVRAGSAGILFSLPISLSFVLKLRKISKEMDIIHFHVPFPLGDLACLMSNYKGKVVVSWHSDIVRQKKMMKFYKPLMEKFLNRADIILVATQGHIDGSDYLPKYRNKCRIIPYGVEPRIEELADKYLIKGKVENTKVDKPVKFLFIGRLVYYKGCDVLIEAFSRVKNAELWVVGTGPLEESLKQKVRDLDISEKVRFRGVISDDEMVECICSCDALVLPSVIKSEAFGLVQLEAMVFEKPVINTNLPSGVPYVSIDKETGLTVEPGSVEQLTKAMQWLADHEDARKTMGKRGRQRVKRYFTTKDMLDNIESIYEELVGRQ
ncbi:MULTISPECIES: glycosyltransferase [unclassified Lacrimispora]|uniref:glycosyltransferase n=1 Tax=unclassified Lacrimispora TaxID=2719232 RepID=UPI00376FCC85